jgi:hypothetical protein
LEILLSNRNVIGSNGATEHLLTQGHCQIVLNAFKVLDRSLDRSLQCLTELLIGEDVLAKQFLDIGLVAMVIGERNPRLYSFPFPLK